MNRLLAAGFFFLMLMTPALTTAVAQEDSPRVWRVYFEGNETYTNMVLQEVVANESVRFTRRMQFWRRSGELYSQTEVRRDVVRIERFYQRRGFPDVHVRFEIDEGKKDWRRNITFIIDEGRPIRVDQVQIDFVDTPQEMQDEITSSRAYQRTLNRNPLRSGQRYQRIRNADVEGSFRNMLQNLGHAFAKVEVVSRVDTLAYLADVHIKLDPGPPTRLGNLTIDGHQTVSAELVRKESGLSTGDRFSQTSLTRAQQEIFSHHLFRFVTISIPEQPRDSTVDLNIRVRENALRSIKLQAGAGTEELLRGGVTWMHRNPFGNAHSFSISARASFIEQRANIDYLIPYVFNTHSSFIISPFGQRLDERSYLLLRAGATNTFVYQYSREMAGTVSYELTRNEEFLKDINFVFRDSTQLYNQSVIRFSGYYNESGLERGSGWAVRPFYEISGFLNTGTLRYQRASLDVRRFIDLSRYSQFGVRVNGGLLFTRDADVLPPSTLYYLGGTNSVRGWGRFDLGPKRASFDSDGGFEGYLPIGGRISTSFNSELRLGIPAIHRNFGIALFFDGGQVWRERRDVDFAEVQFGVGGGVRYQSPVGPIRLDVGYKINPTDEDLNRFNGTDFGNSLSRFGIHFSIGEAF